jgi:hypothetical protein
MKACGRSDEYRHLFLNSTLDSDEWSGLGLRCLKPPPTPTGEGGEWNYISHRFYPSNFEYTCANIRKSVNIFIICLLTNLDTLISSNLLIVVIELTVSNYVVTNRQGFVLRYTKIIHLKSFGFFENIFITHLWILRLSASVASISHFLKILLSLMMAENWINYNSGTTFLPFSW